MANRQPKTNLQTLTKAGVIAEDVVQALTKEQRQKIESLTKQQVDAVVTVHEIVGPVGGMGFI